MNAGDFFASMMPHAQRVSQRTGIDPRLVLAQAALETGYGKSAPGNNFFGIKSHGRKGGNNLQTKEFEGGQMVSKAQSFRGYSDPGQSFDDYGQFLLDNPRYKDVLSAGNLQDQIAAMGRSGYATDPNYASKLSNIAGMVDPNSAENIAAGTMRALGKQPTQRQPVISTSGGGLLGANNTSEAPMTPEPQQRGLLFNMLPEKAQGWMTPERVARLQMALEGATLNPNQGVIESAKQTLSSSLDTKNKNKTAEWLAKNGRPDLAEGVMSGAIDAKSAIGAAMQRAPDAPAAFVALDEQAKAGGLEPGTPEYQNFMLNGGGDPATFRALDMQAKASGYQPGTPEYANFMATRGAGHSAGAAQTGKNEANIATGGEAARVVASGSAQGKAEVERGSEVAEMQRNLPGLLTVAEQLSGLADKATYTTAGQIADETRKQLGLDPSEAAVARAQYIAVIDNQVLPLLRQTFGAAFTEREGLTLKNTLGGADKSPAEKKAVLNAFIEQKKRDLIARGGSVPASGGLVPPPTPDFKAMSDAELDAYIERGGQ